MSMNHIRKIIRESLMRQLNESVTISPDEQTYDNDTPEMETLLDLAYLVKDTVAQLYHRYEFFQELIEEVDYKVYNIVFFGEGYDNRFSFNDTTGPIHDQDFHKLPEDAQKWVMKAVKKRLNDLGLKYTIQAAKEIQEGVPGIVYMITENPNTGNSRPSFNLSNSNYNYIFHKLFGLTDEYGGHMNVSDIEEIALQLITMGDEFSRSDKIAMTGGAETLYSTSKQDAEYLSGVGRNLLSFAQECKAKNFQKLSAG